MPGHDDWADELPRTPLIPAQAGIQSFNANRVLYPWVPAFAGTNGNRKTARNNRVLTLLQRYDFFPTSRSGQGTCDQRRQTRGGMRWPCGAMDVSRHAEAQAAMIRLADRGPPAEDTKPAVASDGVCPPGLSQSKPQTPRAERRAIGFSVVTKILMRF